MRKEQGNAMDVGERVPSGKRGGEGYAGSAEMVGATVRALLEQEGDRTIFQIVEAARKQLLRPAADDRSILSILEMMADAEFITTRDGSLWRADSKFIRDELVDGDR